MNKNLKIVTSYVTPSNLENAIKSDWLPIFCLRSIYSSGLIGKWTDSAIHIKEFSPSSQLYQKWRDSKITLEEFESEFIKELEEIDILKVLEKIDYLATISKAQGVILFSYGEDADNSHRKLLANFLNNLGYFNSTITEL